jgi:MFS family permease
MASLDHSLFGYAIPGIIAEFNTDVGTIGRILSASFVVAAFSTIGIGMLADRFGRRIMMPLCLAGSALLISAMGAAGSLMMLAALRMAGFGVGNSLSPLTGAYVAENIPASKRSLALGILQCGYPIGWCLASFIAAPMMAMFGWRAVFSCALVVAALAAVLYFILPESKPMARVKDSTPDRNRDKLREIFGSGLRRQTFFAFLAFFSFGGAYSGTAFFLPTYLTEFRGFDPEISTLIVGASYGVGIIGYLSAALVGQFLLTRRMTAIIWSLCALPCFMSFVWLADSLAGNVLLFALSAVFFYGTSAVLFTFVTELFPTRIRATGIAVSASAGVNMGFALFPFIVGTLVDHIGWQPAFTVTTLPLLLLCTFALWSCGEPGYFRKEPAYGKA